MRGAARQSGFTLIELLVVTVLIAVAAGMVALRLDGLSTTGRLRAATRQLDATFALAVAEARTTGFPRRLEYDGEAGVLRVHKPHHDSGTWSWDHGRTWPIASGVQIHTVVGTSDQESTTKPRTFGVRLRPSGRYVSHAVILATNDQYAVVVLSPFEHSQFHLLTAPPVADALPALRQELEQDDASQ
jgi:type II secretion system protein H